MMEYGNYVDILNQPVWMDSKLYPLESQAQFGQLTTISQLPNGAYEVVSNGAFTPPQTPPYEHQQYQNVAVGYEMPPSAPVATQHQDLSDYSENDLVIPMELPVFSTSQTDVARELAVVDELVRCRANSFASSSPSPSSPSSTSWASSASSSHSSANSSCGESSLEDFEWSPANPQVKKTAQRGRKRSKPYAPADQIDKRSRKKEQNKNAATRYRMKKKAEVAEIQSEENELEQVKIAHEAKIVDLQREIKLMKGLMLEFFKKQGLVQ
ncbi:activating transcription factor of chaperone isoform X2 [Atheta coriaria]|uniref:activating transcription factor of chaperone isoform X2 n=1 Tax=Dalotia coriaria TaxID=877792 RepID=UPI0031F36CC7